MEAPVRVHNVVSLAPGDAAGLVMEPRSPATTIVLERGLRVLADCRQQQFLPDARPVEPGQHVRYALERAQACHVQKPTMRPARRCKAVWEVRPFRRNLSRPRRLEPYLRSWYATHTACVLGRPALEAAGMNGGTPAYFHAVTQVAYDRTSRASCTRGGEAVWAASEVSNAPATHKHPTCLHHQWACPRNHQVGS